MNAAVIGCGNIGGFYDTPSSDAILTHAHAFLDSKKTKLIACCDTNRDNLEKFRNIWGRDIHAYLSVNEMLQNEKIDIVVIAANTASHYEILQEILTNTKIKHIICEKPFVSNLDEYYKIYSLIHEKNPNLLINFIRCFDPSINRVKELILKEKLGKVLQFSSRVNKGLYHNGSHVLSLVEHLFGEITDFKAMNATILEGDAYGSFWIQTKTADGVLTNFDGSEFSLFEMEIICQRGVIKIHKSGFEIKVYKAKESKKINGTKELILYKEYPNTLQYYAKNSLNFLLKKNSKEQMESHLKLSAKLLKIRENLLQGAL
ncbi:MAG: Gfo/Idh/MocA family oxidoreductase [Sulfurimonas sp.]|uniref:Gfo/Idh/MocA family protein n=1 Tax=Sulfurimonas sp. TaxID=2022749 RepID=UPI00262C85E5|nr:Gfo/Idh/MocA family oxidoreductase [Sulfurimonas sp.]MDD5400649.1 Gfo/Idh/MocA family oxidoreductase [Sulfurimonas sp.]